MAISDEIVSKFVKTLNNKEEKNTSKTLDGTYIKVGNVEYVRLDGSDILTPVKNTVAAENGEKVKVLIDNHIATIVNNETTPSASSKVVGELSETVGEQGSIINRLDTVVNQQSTSINQLNTHITQVDTTLNQHNVIINQQNTRINQQDVNISMINDNIVSMNDTIYSQGNTIEAQGNSIELMNNVITAQGSRISSINDTVTSQGNVIVANSNAITAQGNTITAQGNTIVAQGADIQILNSGFVIENGVLTGLSKISVDSLESTYLKTTFANIDNANVDVLSARKLYAQSGIMQYADISQLQVPGELVGTVVSGDIILANTIKANRILLKNSNDGLFYALNSEGVPEGAIDPQTHEPIPQTDQNSLNGTILVAKSVTASKISVQDLVAFEATIGGFDITDNVISTPTKHFGIGADHISDEFADKFELIVNEPDDWETKYEKYYILSNNYFDHITGSSAPTFVTNEYYKLKDTEEDELVEDAPGLYLNNDGQFMLGAQTDNHIKMTKTPIEGTTQDIWALDIKLNDMTIYSDGTDITIGSLINRKISEISDQISTDGYELLTSEPSDWNTNYKDYYILDDGVYVNVTGNTAPTWTVNTYYKMIPSINTRLDEMEEITDKDKINDMIINAVNDTDFSNTYTTKANMDKAFEDFKKNNIIDYSTYLSYHNGGYELLTSEPSDWNTNYKDYYILDDGVYVNVTGNTAPTWTVGTYYKNDQSNSYLAIGYAGNQSGVSKLAETKVTPVSVEISKTTNSNTESLILAANGIQMKNGNTTLSKWKNGKFAAQTLLVGIFGEDGNMTSGFGFIPRGDSLSFKKLDQNERI